MPHQFAVEDELELKFWRVFEKILRKTVIDMRSYFDNAYTSKELGAALYDLRLMPIYKTIQRSLFLRTFKQILDGQKILGSIEGYLIILYAIFGVTAQITVTTTPAALNIDIVAPVKSLTRWVDRLGNSFVTKGGDRLFFKKIVANVTNRELLRILRETMPAGTAVNFTLNEEM